MKKQRAVFMPNISVSKMIGFILFLILTASPLLYADQSEAGSQNMTVRGGFVKHSSQLILNPDQNQTPAENAQFLPLLNQSLVAFNQNVKVPKEASQRIVLNGGVVGNTQSQMVFAVTQEPQHGTLDKSLLSAGTVIYTPQKDFEGEDKFNFTVQTGSAAAQPAAVNIQVLPLKAETFAAPKIAAGGGQVVDPLLVELNEESSDFFKKQRERKREFFIDLRADNLTVEERRERIAEFRKEESEREQKFRSRQQKFLEKNGDDRLLGVFPDLNEMTEDIANFFSLREPSIEELNKQREAFRVKQRSSRNDFFRDLQSQELSAQEKTQKIREFEAEFLEKERKFLQKRRQIIKQQAEDVKKNVNKPDDDIKNEIVQFFKELF